MGTGLYTFANLFIVLGFVLGPLGGGHGVYGQNQPRQRFVGLDPDVHRSYLNTYNFMSSTPSTTPSRNNAWARLTPTLPAPSQVDCYIEVVKMERRGGVCTRLGGSARPYICQSGSQFHFSPTCAGVVRARERSMAHLNTAMLQQRLQGQPNPAQDQQEDQEALQAAQQQQQQEQPQQQQPEQA